MVGGMRISQACGSIQAGIPMSLTRKNAKHSSETSTAGGLLAQAYRSQCLRADQLCKVLGSISIISDSRTLAPVPATFVLWSLRNTAVALMTYGAISALYVRCYESSPLSPAVCASKFLV